MRKQKASEFRFTRIAFNKFLLSLLFVPSKLGKRVLFFLNVNSIHLTENDIIDVVWITNMRQLVIELKATNRYK